MSEQTMVERAPVIVIDLQTGMFDGRVLPPVHDADAVVEHARAVIAWARRGGRAIAFIRHAGPPGDDLAPGEPGWPVWPALGQMEDEPTFSKNVADAFSNPALGDWVSAQGTGAVILLGAQSEYCVAATLNSAITRGLRVTVVSDAHSTWDADGETADHIVDRHNALFAEAGARVVSTEVLASE